MKKQTKKLAFQKQTVRPLDRDTLPAVQGGWDLGALAPAYDRKYSNSDGISCAEHQCE